MSVTDSFCAAGPKRPTDQYRPAPRGLGTAALNCHQMPVVHVPLTAGHDP